MILRLDETAYRGRAVAVPEAVDPTAVARAVREGTVTAADRTVSVQSRSPAAVHKRVGCIHPEMGLRVRTALAAGGRARGLSTPHDADIRAARETLHELPLQSIETTDERRRVAQLTAETDRLRERVAETRGRLAAHRTLDEPVDDLETALESAARDLSEAETSAAAAEQSLEQRRAAVRTARETLDRRMRLEDELANCQRRARAALVDRLADAYASAVAAVPDGPRTRPADPFAVDPVTAALAVARIADFDAPVVLACDRFADAEAASAWLGAPVIRCEQLRS